MTGKYIQFDISEDEIIMKNGKIYEIVLRSPVKIDQNKAKAQFDVENKELNVEVEVINTLREALKRAEEEKSAPEVKKEIKKIEMKSNLLFDLV